MSDDQVVEVDEAGEIVEVPRKNEEPREANIVPYEGKSAVEMYRSTGGFSLIQRWGKMLAASNMVPDHLKDNPADCALIVSQAQQWDLNPLIVAQSSYVARGRVGYEGKLIASLVNRGLSKKLNYRFSGEGRGLKVVVVGTMRGESEPREVEGSWEDWAKENNPAWKTMPKQMMVYRGAREWARRHNPGVISGIMSIDEVQDLEIRDEKPISVSVKETPISESLDDIVGDVNVETPVDTEFQERRAAAAQREAEKVTPKRGRPKGSKNKPKPVEVEAGTTTDTLGGQTQQESVEDLFD